MGRGQCGILGTQADADPGIDGGGAFAAGAELAVVFQRTIAQLQPCFGFVGGDLRLSSTLTYRFLPSPVLESSSRGGIQDKDAPAHTFGIDFSVVPEFASSLMRTISAFESQTVCGAEDSPIHRVIDRLV
mgnify:CR=1 FL=1